MFLNPYVEVWECEGCGAETCYKTQHPLKYAVCGYCGEWFVKDRKDVRDGTDIHEGTEWEYEE